MNFAPGFRRAPSPIDFSESLDLSRSGRMTATTSADSLLVYLDPTKTPKDGSEVWISIPAGSRPGIAAASLSDLNVSGPPFYANHDMLLIVSWADGVSGTLIDQGAPDAAPTVTVSCNWFDRPTRLVLTFDRDVKIVDTTGLSLTGTSATITGIVSGDGTDTVVLSLSSGLDLADSVTLVVGASNTIQSLRGSVVAEGSHAVTMASRPSELDANVFDIQARSADLSLSGSNITAVTDRSPLATSVTAASGHYPTFTANTGDGTGAMVFADGTGSEQYLSTPNGTPIDFTGEFTLAMLVKLSAHNVAKFYNALIGWDSGAGTGLTVLQDGTAGTLSVAGGNPTQTFESGHFGTGAWFLFFLYRHSGKWGTVLIRAGNTGTATETSTVNPYPNLALTVPLRIGAWIQGSLNDGAAMQLKAMCGFSSYLDATKRENIRRMLKATFSDTPVP